MNPIHAAHRNPSSPPHPPPSPPPMLHRRSRGAPVIGFQSNNELSPLADVLARLPRHEVAAAPAGHPPGTSSSSSHFDAAWHLLLRIDPPSPKPFLILARLYIAAGMTRRAIVAFDDMAAFVGRDPDRDELVYRLYIVAKNGYVKVATELFNKRKQKYDLDVKMYSVLVYGWCKVGRVDMAERFLREMIEKGLEPNVVCYNIILDGICGRSSLHPDDRFDGTVRPAERVFDEMRQRGIEPDVTSYSIVLHVYSRAHKPELSMVKLREL